MNRFFYSILAVNGIKKNSQTYIPYIISGVGVVTMFFISLSLTANSGIRQMTGGDALGSILSFSSTIVGIFSVILLLYTNSFLIKRRKKEFGLFNILGMEKRHIGKIMVWETLFVAVITIVLGLVSGLSLSKLMYLVLLRVLDFDVQLGFAVPAYAVKMTLALFGVIYLLTLADNLRQLYLTKPIELIVGGRVGEREPKTKWLITLIGVISLGAGYYIALTTKSPLQALQSFFVAVILVMVGTYSLFTSGSIWFLKLLRKNKGYYYHPSHFTAVSGMIYRMKQNAVGLANICILSTAVLITISTTISLYFGVEDALRVRYPRNLNVTSSNVSEEYVSGLRSDVFAVLANHSATAHNSLDYQVLSIMTTQQGDTLNTDPKQIEGITPGMRLLNIMTADDYRGMSGRDVSLQPNEALIYSSGEAYPYNSLNVLDTTFAITEILDSLDATDNLAMIDITTSYYLVVKDEGVREQIYRAQVDKYGEKGVRYAHYLGFDLTVPTEGQRAVYQDIRAILNTAYPDSRVEGVEVSRRSFYTVHGGLFFIGLYLGILFVMATVLIIYYKQITEGYEDRERFEIMKKVGMSQDEVKKSIRSQVVTVFFLPLITAGIHIAVAFKFIAKLLAIFNLNNIPLFAWCTVGTLVAFGVLYGLVYRLTARVYYQIVS